MAGATIFDLPTELLQKIFEYLDWDRRKHLTPVRPDIINISRTCRDLRKAVEPILFRNVTLRLRWVNGALAEPGLLRLRQHSPDLIKHTKCVYIDTLFGHFRDPRSSMRSFGVPRELREWLKFIPPRSNDSNGVLSLGYQVLLREVTEGLLATPQCTEFLNNAADEIHAPFRDEVNSLAEQLIASPEMIDHYDTSSDDETETRDVIGDETFFDDIREEVSHSRVDLTTRSLLDRSQKRDLRFKLDAFFVLLLCFPSRLTSLIFESLPTDRMDTLQNQFALQFATLALKIYGGQLKDLTMRSIPMAGSIRAPGDGENINAEVKAVSSVLPDLHALRHLRLSGSGRQTQSRSNVNNFFHWKALSDRISHLDIRDAGGDSSIFVTFIQSFTNLQHLTLGDINLHDGRSLFHRANRPPVATIWLSFLIELRRKMPHVEFDLQESDLETKTSLSASGVRWLLEEAVPKGSNLDFERETRLVEDFESFHMLWSAEDSDRGRLAEEERKDGKLVDLAMSSRWRGLFPGKKH